LIGKTVRFTAAGELLGDLAALDSDMALRRRLRRYAAPDVLVIDEIGYLSYSNQHADLLLGSATEFAVFLRRQQAVRRMACPLSGKRATRYPSFFVMGILRQPIYALRELFSSR
jgi:hypothetical protein